MKTFKAQLIARIKRSADAESFRFNVRENLNFTAGQFLKVVFDSGKDDLNKHLSFSSSPLKNYIEVTKKISESSFSKKLTGLKINDTVLIEGPFGKCVFKDEYKKIAFLVGGIGITPVISIIEYIFDKKLKTDAVIFYSNKTEEDIAFKKELDGWRTKNSNIKVYYAITNCRPLDKTCIAGRINKEILTKNCPDLKERKIFIIGPSKMVMAMKDICIDLGSRIEDLLMETFIGY